MEGRMAAGSATGWASDGTSFCRSGAVGAGVCSGRSFARGALHHAPSTDQQSMMAPHRNRGYGVGEDRRRTRTRATSDAPRRWPNKAHLSTASEGNAEARLTNRPLDRSTGIKPLRLHTIRGSLVASLASQFGRRHAMRSRDRPMFGGRRATFCRFRAAFCHSWPSSGPSSVDTVQN